MTTTPDPKTVREIAENAMRGAIRDDMFWQVNQAVIEHGVPGPASKGSTFEAYRSAAIAEYNRMADALSWPPEQPQDERDDAYGRLREFADACDPDAEILAGPPAHDAPYLSLSDLEALLNGHVVLERIAEDAVAELKRQQDKQPQDDGDVRELAWHELRRFSGPALLDEGDVDQHEITHSEQCLTLPPGAVCWAEHQPFRWWWPTAHGTYRIRPEDLLTGGSEDGPEFETTLRVQVLRDGEWFEYSNDVIGADPTDETPVIRERLKAALEAGDVKESVKRTPEQRCAEYEVDILDPDGWRGKNDPPWDEPITLADFYQRARQSTARNVPDIEWQRIARNAKARKQQ